MFMSENICTMLTFGQGSCRGGEIITVETRSEGDDGHRKIASQPVTYIPHWHRFSRQGACQLKIKSHLQYWHNGKGVSRLSPKFKNI